MNSVNAPFNSQPPFSPPFDQNAANSPFGQQLAGNSINPSSLDLLQYQGDGNSLSQSPNPSQTPFQVPPVVPAKRGRPGEDVTASPRPLQHNASSRSHTPQQFSQYAGQPGAQQFQTPTPFQQMQHVGSAHASPSPGPQNQMNSPRSFQGQPNPMAQFGQLQNQMNRMGTPQNSQPMMRGMNPGPNQNSGMDGSAMGSPFPNSQGQGSLNPQMDAMRRQYQVQLARNQQQMQNVQQGDQQNPMMGQRGGAWPAGVNGQPTGRPGMPQGPGPQTADGDKPDISFSKSLKSFQDQRNRPFNPNPTVCGQPISYYRLFMAYGRVNPASNPQGWQALAAAMGLSPDNQAAVQGLRQVFETEMKEFYFVYWKAMQQRRQRGQMAGQMPQMPMQGSPTQRNEGLPPASGPMALQQPNQASSPGLHRAQNSLGVQPRHGLPQQSNVNDATADMNGHRKSGSLFSNLGTPDPGQQDSSPQTSGKPNQPIAPVALEKPPGDSVFDPQYQPRRRPLTRYGGLDIDAFSDMGGKIRDLKTYPRFEELGNVDLHVLNMCLLSGFNAEIKYALDRLCALSQAPLRLWECEDLFDSLLECGESQLEQLNGHDEFVTETTVNMPNFHDTVRSSVTEIDTLLDGAGFGNPEYQTEHAVDRLLAVTTILRNLSFPLHEVQMPERELDANAKILTGPNVRNLITGCIKCLDLNRNTDMRTARNVQDLMKDLITILSNIADGVELSSEEEARTMIEFILAFAPPNADARKSTSLEFVMYHASKHQYLPCAVDSLAKLLARDDPNRSFYRAIFHADAHEQQPTAGLLITRAFSLALAPIPDMVGGAFSTGAANQVAMQRRPFLSQGMLAADILSTLVPAAAVFGHDVDGGTSLENRLLKSKDGWSSRLMRLIMAMAISDAGMQPGRDRTTGQIVDAPRPFTMITQRGLSMMRRMVEKADRAEAEQQGVKRESISLELFSTAPLEGVLFSAMSVPAFDADTMKYLSAIANMAR